MDDKKDNAELIQEYFNILEEHYNVTVLHELYQGGTENIYVSMPDDGYDTVYSQVQFLDYMSDISSIRKSIIQLSELSISVKPLLIRQGTGLNI